MIGGWQRWSLSEPPCGLGLTSLSRLFGACTHGYTGSCSCVSRTSVARAASARTASCCCMSSTSLARGHIPRRSLKSTQSLGAAGAGCGWHHRRAGARVWLRPAVARVRACMQKKAGETKKWLQRPGFEPRAGTLPSPGTHPCCAASIEIPLQDTWKAALPAHSVYIHGGACQTTLSAVASKTAGGDARAKELGETRWGGIISIMLGSAL